ASRHDITFSPHCSDIDLTLPSHALADCKVDVIPFIFSYCAPHPDLHSFPTRRSSDLLISTLISPRSYAASVSARRTGGVRPETASALMPAARNSCARLYAWSTPAA